MAEPKKSNKERLREITEGIEQGIKELFESDKYRQYLSTMSRFHRYSVNNVTLIHMQMPGATHVAGFNRWRDQFARHVKKGEHGITIIAPTPFKKKIEQQKLDPDTKAPMLDKDGKVITEEKEIEIPMFRPVKVFDVSQTEGKPLPQLASDLTGNVRQFEAFLEALRRSSPVPVSIEPLESSMDGYFSPEEQKIVVRSGMSEVQTVSAAVHEIAHAKLHNYEKEREATAAGNQQEPPKKKDRQTEEVEAESISYTVCQYFGIQTGENSFGYIATWSSGKELPELRASLETIQKTSNGLISDIEGHFKEICKERGIDLTEQADILPAEDTIELFASDLHDYMNQLHRAGLTGHPYSLDDRDRAVADISHELHHGQFYDMRELLRFVSNQPRASSGEALLYRLDMLERAREEALEYRVHDNPQAENGQEQSYLQVYEKGADGQLIDREIIYAGSREQCNELLEQLHAGLMSYKDVWEYAIRPLTELEKLYVLDDAIYLYIQSNDSGYDYTLYDANTQRQMDGGQLNRPDLPLSTAALEICQMHDMGAESIKLAPLELIETLQEAVAQQMQSEVAQCESDQVQDISVQTVEAPVQAEDLVPDPETSPVSMLPDAPEQALDEYPMPDEQLQMAALEACGYMDGDMLPLSKEQALELFDKELTVYAVVDGGSAEMLFDREEFEMQAPTTVLAVPREEWEQSPMFHDKIMERADRQPEREAAFLSHEGDCFAIYQVTNDDPNNVRFMSMDWMQSHDLSIDRANYDLIYTAPLEATGSTQERLEALYEQFNIRCPADYHSPSLSVSDIIAVKQDGVVSCHYCDSVGFREVPGFLPQMPDNPLKNAEMSMEDDYGMIDGIINNGSKEQPTVAQLEQQARSGQPISLMDLADAVHREEREKKRSVVEQLKSQPKQEKKKTAPKKSAEMEI